MTEPAIQPTYRLPVAGDRPAAKRLFRERMEEIGIEAICERIESGESQNQIAYSLQASPSTLNEWLHSCSEYSTRVRRAIEVSAEAWLDRGIDAVDKAMRGVTDPDTGKPFDVHAAKTYASECARRAAIRNAAYRERSEVTQINVTAQLTDADLQAQIAQLEAQTGMLARLGLRREPVTIDQLPAPAIESCQAPAPQGTIRDTPPVDNSVDNSFTAE